MKIRSLLLGSVAAAGLATTGYAADLGVVTSLDVCDELGLSGLTISSDDNCLVITGNVSFEYNVGDYNDADSVLDADALPNEGADFLQFDRSGGVRYVPAPDGVLDSSADVDAWLKFVATADSDFGPAIATIKLISENNTGTSDWTVGIDEAWVGIGDTTILVAGYAPSIFKDGDDTPLNYLGLFNSSQVDTGVGFAGGPTTGQTVIQLGHHLGNGLQIWGGLEGLGVAGVLTGVGTLLYSGDGVSAHASAAVNTLGVWKTHAGFKGAWDPITVVGAIAADSTGWWNGLGSVELALDMFKIAASAEATSGNEYGVGGSLSATVTDGVTLNLGGRYFTDTDAPIDTGWQVEAGISAAATETITVTAAIGAEDSNRLAAGFIYGKAGLAWAPGGGFTSSVEGYANTLGGYKATFKAAKSIK
jgi:hypothetical protein